MPSSSPKPSAAPKHAAAANSNHDKTRTQGTTDSRVSTAHRAIATHRTGFAAPARRIATSCPAASHHSHSHNMPEEARIEDPLDITPPVIGTNDVITNDNAKLVIYEPIFANTSISVDIFHDFGDRS